MAPRLLTAALLLTLFAVSAFANDCEICRASNPSDCDRGGVATLNGNPNYIQGHGVTSCAQAYQYVTCGDCKNGQGIKIDDCCTLACKDEGQGNVKAHCLCGPPKDNPGADHDGQQTPVTTGACADPHFRGAFGIQYDFHGLPDRDFNLITDQGLTMNAHFIGQDGLETGFDGTWMSALGFMWAEKGAVRSATFTVKEGSAAFTESAPFVIEIDGQELHPESFLASVQSQEAILFEDEGLSIKVAPFAYSFRVSIREHIDIIVTAATHEHPAGNHIDIGISKLNVTGTVHGALGQTFAAHRAEALKAAAAIAGSDIKFDAADVIEGKDVDYMTTSLLSTDFVYNRFKPMHAGPFSKINVIARKLLRLSTVDQTESTVDGELACKNMRGGGLVCFS
ncbi:hypothetical protein KFL_000700220 [Klebsormidium nitens]|uniref:Root cap family protein n=1 Tax=Klebsormidium nitens TaxID=105231 RepID=A0A1Y1HR19_KLENI|nr:hypothetical protein KFL_000700220 [Klebsormidium nitens]|eukprot:GAQ81085.1 hypothetical protein KFL_000700220 [Klebsormidium nitens]